MIVDDFSAKTPATWRSPSCMVDLRRQRRDGIPDFIVGKRLQAHQDTYTDPDPYGPARLVLVPHGTQSESPGWRRTRTEADSNRSGVGSTVLAVDLNKDGALRRS